MKKILILDSGTLITLAMNGLLNILEKLKKNSNVRLAITHEVKRETIDRPISVPRFELEALRIQELLDERILELPESFEISNEKISKITSELMEKANHSVMANGKWMNIVSDAEISCLALSKELAKQKIESMIAIDERTTRVLSEKPESLEKIMSEKLHAKASINKKNLADFASFKFIRSTELVYVAYKKNLLDVKGKKALEAALYATKYKGSSVSFEEINELKKL